MSSGAATPRFRSFMSAALDQARAAATRNEAPIGAVIVDPQTNAIIAAAGNETRARPDPTAHAEIIVLRAAAERLGQERLSGLDLWVTLEPCPMCAGAIALARIRRLYYGAHDPKGGGVAHGPRIFAQSTCNHRPEIYSGVDESACAALLRRFFAERR
ncbi:MAG: nucleoside deaminase [Neomegalonema sp.]|nr:nucleoside deaminase [Neomegalonema sp.]